MMMGLTNDLVGLVVFPYLFIPFQPFFPSLGPSASTIITNEPSPLLSECPLCDLSSLLIV